MRARDVARDRKPQAGAALILVAGMVETQERLEHLLAHMRRNAGPVVVDRHRQPAVVAMADDGDRARVARGVRNQVGEAALERGRPHGDDRLAMECDGGLVAVALGLAAQLLEQRRHVGRRRLLAGIAAREGQIGLQHARHLIDILAHRLDLGAVADQSELELEAREDRAQVVRDASQHRGALLDGALDAGLHLDEGGRRAPHLARAARTEVRHFAALAEALGGVGEAQDRPDLVAQKGDRDSEQHDRRAHHPQQEDVGVRRVGRVAAGEHPHHRVVEPHPDLNQRRAPHRIDPEWPADLPADLLRERLVEQREERLRPRRRHLGHRQEIDPQAELFLGQAADLRLLGQREGRVNIDERADVLHHGAREPLRDGVPMALHERERDHRLQDHHRHDDDQESASVEALRHHAAQREAVTLVQVCEPICGRAQHTLAGVERGHGVVTSR